MSILKGSLDDRYVVADAPVLLSGSQALVRLLLLQHERDRRAGLSTAGFVSGYRGSPLGGFDRELWRARQHLDPRHIVFSPALNEELAATAVWGSQQSILFPAPRYQGVFGLWYGKGPGVDRAGDALKHANLGGTARYGGALAVFGDDHAAKSSTTAHQSEQALVAASIPVLYPATVAEVLEFGLLGWAMSRYTGLWIGLKCINETAEATARVDAPLLERQVSLPEASCPPELYVHMRFEPVASERRLHELRLPRVAEFARANALDRVIIDPPVRRLGLIAAGKSYLDARHALRRLGIDDAKAMELGIGMLKLGLTWPIDSDVVRAFARGFEELLVIEEKRPLIEEQLVRVLYHEPVQSRPQIVGKQDAEGRPVFPSHGTLEVHHIARVLVARLRAVGGGAPRLGEALEAWTPASRPPQSTAVLARAPYYCSGCPHNRSTVVPAGSLAMAGIGCSSMALWMDRDTIGVTQMGGEGANWIGIAPFTDTPHVFQNVGDGTYVHSGILAIRAAVAADVSITYKLLFNGTVAMTGGQPLEGALDVPRLVDQLRAEGVRRIDVVTDEPAKYAGSSRLPAEVMVHDRRELEAVQKTLRSTAGTTVLLYDQGCAAEKRRGRARGRLPRPGRRAFINSEVCEGCGDCSRASNCVSILPLVTDKGLKRVIDQSTCNQDFSCLEGYCPAFVTIEGGVVRKAGMERTDIATAPLPLPEAMSKDTSCALLVTGIGGSGVVTVGAILAMAAHLQGIQCSVFDMTGLAQKNGAVVSHVRISHREISEVPAQIGVGEATALLACDLLVTQLPDIANLLSQRTRVVANTHVLPTGAFQVDGTLPPDARALLDALLRIVPDESLDALDASEVAVRMLGDSVYTNLLMVGYLWQRGALPLEEPAILRAIEINGAAVAANKEAFRLGRELAVRKPPSPGGETNPDRGAYEDDGLDSRVRRGVERLTAYQDWRYARRFSEFVQRIGEVERDRLGSDSFAAAVADSLVKLMAYKDEYEVARLHTRQGFSTALQAEFAGDFRIIHHFAPPALGARKRAFGAWVRPWLKLLASARCLRGGWFDPFGYASERRQERQLVREYCERVNRIAAKLTPDNVALATRIAELPLAVRGFGHVKQAAVARYREELRELESRFIQIAASGSATDSRVVAAETT